MGVRNIEKIVGYENAVAFGFEKVCVSHLYCNHHTYHYTCCDKKTCKVKCCNKVLMVSYLGLQNDTLRFKSAENINETEMKFTLEQLKTSIDEASLSLSIEIVESSFHFNVETLECLHFDGVDEFIGLTAPVFILNEAAKLRPDLYEHFLLQCKKFALIGSYHTLSSIAKILASRSLDYLNNQVNLKLGGQICIAQNLPNQTKEEFKKYGLSLLICKSLNSIVYRVFQFSCREYVSIFNKDSASKWDYYITPFNAPDTEIFVREEILLKAKLIFNRLNDFLDYNTQIKEVFRKIDIFTLNELNLILDLYISQDNTMSFGPFIDHVLYLPNYNEDVLKSLLKFSYEIGPNKNIFEFFNNYEKAKSTSKNDDFKFRDFLEAGARNFLYNKLDIELTSDSPKSKKNIEKVDALMDLLDENALYGLELFTTKRPISKEQKQEIVKKLSK